MPDRIPEDIPKYMPEDMLDRMPEDMLDRMLEDLLVRKCINVMVGIIRNEIINFLIFLCNIGNIIDLNFILIIIRNLNLIYM